MFVDSKMLSSGELKRADLKRATSALRKTLRKGTHTHTAHADIHRNMSNEGSLSHTAFFALSVKITLVCVIQEHCVSIVERPQKFNMKGRQIKF